MQYLKLSYMQEMSSVPEPVVGAWRKFQENVEQAVDDTKTPYILSFGSEYRTYVYRPAGERLGG
jgi:hypothetical protein